MKAACHKGEEAEGERARLRNHHLLTLEGGYERGDDERPLDEGEYHEATQRLHYHEAPLEEHLRLPETVRPALAAQLATHGDVHDEQHVADHHTGVEGPSRPATHTGMLTR